MKSRGNPHELTVSNRVYKEKRVGSFDVIIQLFFFTYSLMTVFSLDILGVRALPPFLRGLVFGAWLLVGSVVGEDQCGDDGVVVAHFDGDDLRLDGVPGLFGAGEDVVNLLGGFGDAEYEIARCAVEPLVHELPNHRVGGRGIEVTG